MFTASWPVHGVVVAVWVLDAALVVVSRGVVAVVAAVVGSDVAAERWGSGLENRGRGLSWGAVGRHGSQCRRSAGAGGGFEAGEEVVVVVVDDVVDVDGGCAGVVSGDVAGLWGARGGGAGRCGPLLACTAVSQV